MALDLASKKRSWVNRLIQDATAAVDAINRAVQTSTEYTTDAYNGGDPVNRPEYEITDADLAGIAPHLDAAKLNALVGGLNTVRDALASVIGQLEAARP